MSTPLAIGLLAVDVGSTSAKLGWFPGVGACAGKPPSDLAIAAPRLPEPDVVLRLQHARRGDDWLAPLDEWLDEQGIGADAACLVASVHADAAAALTRRLGQRSWARLDRLAQRDIPIAVRTKEPQRVGVDRLLGALAANRLRDGAPAIVVDMGTAITVNLVAADGAFEGGAILAGPGTALWALHHATASLPLVAASEIAANGPPPALGVTTDAALAAGAFWGAVGAIRELVERMARDCPQPPQLFLTGGGARHVAPLIDYAGRPARYLPHLVLAGVRVAAEGLVGG